MIDPLIKIMYYKLVKVIINALRLAKVSRKAISKAKKADNCLSKKFLPCPTILEVSL